MKEIKRSFVFSTLKSEASDWEAKFYQIQSKYLLLLNELHNPQVSVSASRQEMVSQLLNDVIEAAETRSGPLAKTGDDGNANPALLATAGKAANYDRFGFRIDLGHSTDSVENKVEKLRRQAEENLNQAEEAVQDLEDKWDEAVTVLKSKVPFTMTTDIKNLLRLGIPISQRVS